jgi:transposase-like protein
MWSYERAISKEFTTHKRRKERVEHIRNVGIAKEENNNLVERYHGEFREFDKIRRGFKSDATMEEWNEGFRLYHNFIKRHMGLNGLTPSQVAEINLRLGRNRWLELLKESLNHHPNSTESNNKEKSP